MNYRLQRILDFPMDTVRKIIWFCQRGARGYADCDVWSLNTYLCRIMSETSDFYADSKRGTSAQFLDEGVDYRTNDEAVWSKAEESQKEYFKNAKIWLDYYRNHDDNFLAEINEVLPFYFDRLGFRRNVERGTVELTDTNSENDIALYERIKEKHRKLYDQSKIEIAKLFDKFEAWSD